MATRQSTGDALTGSVKIGPDDPRYLAVVEKRFNKRFSASPLPPTRPRSGSSVRRRGDRRSRGRTGERRRGTTYAGRINTVAHDATAASQRNAILDIACTAGWLDRRDEAKNLTWVRSFYQNLFAESGGVPVPNAAYDGALINHPDTDLADPAWNASGVPWHALYYKESYPRLQRIKARWDPRDVFRHALSIRAE